MKKLLFLFFLLTTQISFSQIILKGIVVNAENSTPIAFANIGIINTNIGTISNSDGTFEITIPDSLSSRSIIFSSMGFQRKEFMIPDKSILNLKIELEEATTVLDDVVIRAKSQLQKKWHGNPRKGSKFQGTMNYDSTSAGGAIALLIEKEKSLYNFVEQAEVYVFKNTLPAFKVRIRFLSVDSINDYKPGKDLYDESIVLTSTINKGWLKFDLKDRNIYLPDDKFFVEFEWLIEESDRLYIANSHQEFIKNNPNSVNIDTVLVDNVAVPTISVSGHVIGTFFHVNTARQTLSKMVTYNRQNSYAPWQRAAGILRARVLLTD